MRGDLCVFLDRELSEKKRDDPRTEKLGDVLFSIYAFCRSATSGIVISGMNGFLNNSIIIPDGRCAPFSSFLFSLANFPG